MVGNICYLFINYIYVFYFIQCNGRRENEETSKNRAIQFAIVVELASQQPNIHIRKKEK